MPLVMILDDRVTNRNIFAKLAASISEDVRVETHGDPASALAAIGAPVPDLVITDYKMPGMNGAEFVRRFREIPGCEDVPVIAITVYEVISRYVFNSPTFWAHESTTFLIAAIFLIGGPIALARDKHIRVRMIYDAVSPAARRWLDIVNSIIAMIFFAGLAYAGWIMSWKATHSPTGEIHLEGTGTSWNPPTPAMLKLLVLACVALMFVQSLLHLIKAIRRDVDAPANIAGERS